MFSRHLVQVADRCREILVELLRDTRYCCFRPAHEECTNPGKGYHKYEW